jgi:hypothetical protein
MEFEKVKYHRMISMKDMCNPPEFIHPRPPKAHTPLKINEESAGIKY